MAQIGSLSVKLGLVTVEWDKATKEAKAKAKDLQNAMNDLGGGIKTLQGHLKTLGGSVGIGAIGIGALMQKSLEFSNQIKDLSEGFGISISKTLQFQDALKTSGGSAQNAAKIMATLFGKIDEARKGNEVVISQFQEMGISFAELSRMSPEQALDRVFKALSKIDDEYKKIKTSKEFLGKGGVGVVASSVSAELDKSLTKYKDYEDAIKKIGDVSDNLKKSMSNLTIAFTSLIAPFAKDGYVSIEKFRMGLIALGAVGVARGIYSVTNAVLALVAAIKAGNVALAASGGMLGFAATVVAGLVATSVGNSEDQLQKAKDMPVKKRMVWKGNELVEEKVLTEEEKKQLELREQASNAVRKELLLLQEKTKTQKALADLAIDEIQQKQKMAEMNEHDRQIAEIEYAREKDLLKVRQEWAKSLADNREKTSLHGAINAMYEGEIKNINAVADAKKRVADQDEANRQSFMFGWEKAYREYTYESLNMAKFGAEAFTSVVSNMNSALAEFVKTGKLNFKSLAQSIIQDLIRIQLQAQLTGIFKSMGGSLGSIFGSSSGLASLPSSVNRTFADGGTPPVGVPSLVGERGPELFIPNQSGTIIPNNQLSTALGGSTINYNGPYIASMSAIDTQSASQFLAKNKNAVWAANQSANRSMPASR